MEWFKCILLAFVLLFTASLPAAESGKQPSVLLQEAVYAEETEGDIEKAIGLYEQVIKETGKIERLGAEATYRLGMCHLKKGDKEQAAQYFQKVVTNYQNQSSIASKANQQLQKIKPQAGEFSRPDEFGPVVELDVPYVSDQMSEPITKVNCFIDFETGKLFKMPEEYLKIREEYFKIRLEKTGKDEGATLAILSKYNVYTWCEQNKLDAMAYLDGATPKLGQEWFKANFTPAPGKWDTHSSGDIKKMLQEGGQADDTRYEKLPATFAFTTYEGNIGLLQLISSTKVSIKIRYKMLQNVLGVFVTEITTGAREVYLPDIETKDAGVILDLASGELLKVEPGKNEEEIVEYFRLLGKGDIAYDFASNKGALITLRAGKVYNTEVVNGLLNIKPLAILFEEKGNYEYQLPDAPCKLYVVTGGNRRFIVDVISGDDKGINIKYSEVNMPIQLEGRDGILDSNFVNVRYRIEVPETRKVYIPDGDTKNTGVILDLASGKLLDMGRLDQLEKDPNKIFKYFTTLGQGDLFYDRVLGCLRGGKVSIIGPDGSTNELPVMERIGDATAYVIAPPCKLMVKTAEGDNYEVNVLGADDKGGINIEYRKLNQQEIPKAATLEKDVFLPEDTKALDMASGELLTVPLGEKEVDIMSYFRRLGKGDIGHDQGIIATARGGTVQLLDNDKIGELIVLRQESDSKTYEIPYMPCRVVITTAEGLKFEAMLLYEKGGIRIQYTKLSRPVISGPRETAQAFLDALWSGNTSEATKFAYPGSKLVDDLKDACEELRSLSLSFESVYANETAAFAISKPVTTKKRTIWITVSLLKYSEKWLVNAINNYKVEIDVKTTLEKFFEKNPDAKELPIKKREQSEIYKAALKKFEEEKAAEMKRLSEIKEAEIKRLEAEKNKNQ